MKELINMAVVQIPSGKDTLIITAEFVNRPPVQLFDYWTKPNLLQKWWPPEAEVDPQLGGMYHFFWPQMNWHLRGHYITFKPEEELAFTWIWDHYPLVKEVVVSFEALASLSDSGGTKITIHHGPYDDSEQSQIDRQGHLEGWTYFLEKLQNLGEYNS